MGHFYDRNGNPCHTYTDKKGRDKRIPHYERYVKYSYVPSVYRYKQV